MAKGALMGSFKEKFQQFGQAMLVPISLIAISGLFLGFGGVFTNETTMTSLGVDWASYQDSFIYDFFSVWNGLGSVIIGNLGILYAVGCAFSISRKEKGWAAFSAVVCYLALLSTVQVLLNAQGLSADNTTVEALEAAGLDPLAASKEASLYTTYLGFFCYSFGVFGGILVGCLVAWLTSRFYNTKLPTALAFFAGTRTVPILSLLLGGILGIVIFFVWPMIGGLLSGLAQFVHDSGLIGTFVYRFADECLVPFGMHPILETPMYWTELGGSMMVDGVRVVGNSGIQLAQLASPDNDKLLVRAFMGGLGCINYAIYPGIAVAMWSCAKKENKPKVAGLLIPTIVSTVFFGVTEPILFTFLFVAPWLYFGVYAPLAASAEVLCEVFKVSVYQGNIKDLIPFLLRPEKLNLWPYLFLLPLYFIAAFLIFRFLIKKFDLKTPGREDDIDPEDIHLIDKAEYNARTEAAKASTGESADVALAKGIVAALGGRENIESLENCISRLRVIVRDGDKIAPDDVFTKSLKAMGVVHISKNSVQIIYGPAVGGVAADVHDALGL